MRIPWRHLLPVAALYLAVTSCWLIAIPPFEGPDELQHYDYARYVAATGHLPDHAPARLNEGGWFTAEWLQEPAYYWALGQALRLVGAGTAPLQFLENPYSRWHGGVVASLLRHDTPVAPALARGVLVGRIASLLAGFITLFCVFGAVHAYTGRSRIAALAAASVALIPEFGVHHMLVSNDPAACCLASIASLLWIRWYVSGAPQTWQAPAAIGTVSGLAIATKLTTAFLLAMGPLLFLVRYRLAKDRTSDATHRLPLWQCAAVWIVTVLAGGAWNFVRNWRLFGDPLATALKHTLLAQQGDVVHFHPGELSSYRNLAHVIFHGFWVSVGWTDWGPEATWIWLLYGLLTMVLLLAVGAAVVKASRPEGLVSVLLVVVVLNAAAFAAALALTPGNSMRYLLPLTVPLAVIVVAGLQELRAHATHSVTTGHVRWMIVALIGSLALAWLATFGEALTAFRFGGRI